MSSSSDEIKIISRRLKEQRIKSKVTQKKIADILGVNRDTVIAFENENNARLPNAWQLRKLAERYGVSTDYLVGLNDNVCNSESYEYSRKLNLSDKSVKYLLDLADRKKGIHFNDAEGKKKIRYIYDMIERYLSEDYEEINILLAQVKDEADYYDVHLGKTTDKYDRKEMYKKLKSIRYHSYEAYEILLGNLLNNENSLSNLRQKELELKK
ncbi:MAG: helix-turn-helix transcriptional regulator [Clostridia bacterium]|nr:helix-turn-helix transcriptional regulator [Clostridia bacterium]